MPSHDYTKYDKRFHEDQAQYDIETLNQCLPCFTFDIGANSLIIFRSMCIPILAYGYGYGKDSYLETF